MPQLFAITPDQRQILEEVLVNDDTRPQIRQYAAVIKLLDDGTSCTLLAQAVGLPSWTIYAWYLMYGASGVEGLVQLEHMDLRKMFRNAWKSLLKRL